MRKYTRDKIVERITLAANDMSTFYNQDFINYVGVTSDTNEPYTEVISEFLLNHLELFDQIKMISRENSYQRQNHNGTTKNPSSNRIEERIALSMFEKSYTHIGEILDYQIPLKNKQSDKNVGKIDLLAFDEQVLRLLELKVPESKETLLRCVLEANTYLRIVDKKKLINDFRLNKRTEEIQVKASPFVFYNGYQHEEYKRQLPNLIELMKQLDSHLFLIKEIDICYHVVNP